MMNPMERNWVEVLLPKAAIDPATVELTPRPASLDGAVLGFVWNSKPNGDALFDRFARAAREEFGVADIKRASKPSAATGATDDLLAEVADSCDLAVVAVGD